MGPVGEPPAPVGAYQLKPRVVHEGGRLERLARIFSRQTLLCHPMEFRID
jgi:hypothetical protein